MSGLLPSNSTHSKLQVDMGVPFWIQQHTNFARGHALARSILTIFQNRAAALQPIGFKGLTADATNVIFSISLPPNHAVIAGRGRGQLRVVHQVIVICSRDSEARLCLVTVRGALIYYCM